MLSIRQKNNKITNGAFVIFPLIYIYSFFYLSAAVVAGIGLNERRLVFRIGRAIPMVVLILVSCWILWMRLMWRDIVKEKMICAKSKTRSPIEVQRLIIVFYNYESPTAAERPFRVLVQLPNPLTRTPNFKGFANVGASIFIFSRQNNNAYKVIVLI